MRIVALNWRDIRNPAAGGAEVHLHEILRRLVAAGHEVVQLASGWPGARRAEAIDGVDVRRTGSWWNANFALPLLYRRGGFRARADVVIDDVNKIPFFAPLFAGRPVLAVVPHLFGRTVFQETSWLFAAYVYAYEALIPAVYRRTEILAISESTRADLARRGLDPRRIHVTHCGLDHEVYSVNGTAHEPGLVVYLGRLQRYKGVQTALRAFERVRAAVPEARLVVVGEGPYRRELEALAGRLHLSDAVEFRGHVPAAEKVALLRRAAVTVNPSPKEGWALTVVEAAACGTPVVASRSPGLVDSVRDGETGLLVPHGDAAALARGLTDVLRDPVLRARLSANAREWAAGFTWECAAAEAEALLRRVAAGESGRS